MPITLMNQAYTENLAAAQDPLQQKLLRELGNFYRWLDKTGALGFLGEIGVSYQVDSASWNAALDSVYYQLNKYNMWATAWAAGKALGTSPLQVYLYNSGTSTWSTTATATIVEKHPSITNVYQRGVNLSGAEYGTNALRPGTEGTNYFHHLQADYNFIAGRGIKLIRFPFRWERLQPTLGAALDSTYLTSLTNQVTFAGNAGMQVILDPHNSGGYFAVDGVERAIGASGGPTSANFADLWSRIATSFQSNANIAGYDLMNEPHLIDTTANWESYAQAAVSAIRTAESTGTHKLIMVPVGEDWTNNPSIEQRHPNGPWITDTANNHRYTAHLYPITANWDQPYSTHSAAYRTSGYRPAIPSISVPPHSHSDTPKIGNQTGQAGGNLENPTVRGDAKIENKAIFPFKAWLLQTSGGALDLKSGGADFWISTYSDKDFTTGQIPHVTYNHSAQLTEQKTILNVQKRTRYTKAALQTLSNSSTINLGSNGEGFLPVSALAGVSSIAIAAGTDGDEIRIVNRSAFTITFATSTTTSRVAESTATIPPSRGIEFCWDADFAGSGVGRWVRLAS